MPRITLILTLLAALLPAVAFADDAGVELRPIWRESQAGKYRVTQTELTTTHVPGVGEQQSTMDINIEIGWRVKQADPAGGGTAVMTVNLLTMKITDAEGKAHTVTATQSEDELKAMRTWITALTGSPIEVDIGPDGAIGNVRGLEAVHRKAPEMAKKMDDKFFQDLAMDLSVMSGGKSGAKIGKEWRFKFTNSHSTGEITFDAVSELQAVQKIAGIDVAIVNRKGKLSLKPDLGDLPADAPPITVKLTTGEYSGQIMFDLSRHELVGGHFDQTVEIAVEVTREGEKMTSTTKEVTSTQVLRIAEE